METIDSVLREMREDIEKGNVPLWADFGSETARDYVARLEAAIKREREAVGNAAKMRNALECIDSIAKYLEAGTIRDVQHAYRNIQDRVRIALSAPARNCDLLADAQEAMTAIHNDRCCVQNPIDERRLTVNWLFAEAKGNEK